MKKQTTDTVLMIRPVAFRMNEQTAVNNHFQQDMDDNNSKINAMAQKEFDAFVDKLKNVGVSVIVVDDIEQNNTPDSIFPNNWVSFHQNGDIALYPMFAPNRRKERREDILQMIEDKGFVIENEVDYTSGENEGVFLEGTGAMILDRENEIAYCALSPRSDEDLFIEFCEDFEFTPVLFNTSREVDGKKEPIYHTNVMMSVAKEFVVICLDCIQDKKQRKAVVSTIKESGKEIIEISIEQMYSFAGNMLELQAKDGGVLVMSQTAYNSLTKEQIKKIEKHCSILYSDLSTIETCGGGSARCMLAEVFLPKKQ